MILSLCSNLYIFLISKYQGNRMQQKNEYTCRWRLIEDDPYIISLASDKHGGYDT